MDETTPNTSDDKKVSGDAVYREMYTEMRRFRDYQFSSSMWYTASLLAIFGFLIASRFGTPPTFNNSLTNSYLLKFIVLVMSIVIAGASCYLIKFADWRYNQLRNWTDMMEPKWKDFKPETIPIKPSHIYHATPWVIVISIFCVIYL